MEDLWNELAEELAVETRQIDRTQFAVNLLSLGEMSVTEISEIANLPVEEVENLAKNLTPTGV
ncbi:MAG: hypothetical protein NC253_12145 [Ruminococcus sp.]|nr:hypothetical protein [Ruminococcus sp.]MCM1480549.1 hypothetical protein [Muribaculaceae bacterium]